MSAAPPVRLPELLAPAGNLEKLQTVVNFGADAVYLGGPQYGLRAFADNFSFEEIKIAVRWAHDRGVRVYVTLNILAHPADMNGLPAYVEHLQACGADAVIVSDPGVFMTVRRYARNWRFTSAPKPRSPMPKVVVFGMNKVPDGLSWRGN